MACSCSTGVINPIVAGYCWSQQFTAPAGTLVAGDQLRVEMRNTRDGTARFTLTQDDGVGFEDQTIQIDLTAEQTAWLTDLKPLIFDVKIIREGCDVYLSPIIRVPVVEPVTKGVEL